jgi:hypothetical protein
VTSANGAGALPELQPFLLALFQFLKKKNLSGLFWSRMWPITSLDSQVIPDNEEIFHPREHLQIPSHSP